jgi:dolichol kinase
MSPWTYYWLSVAVLAALLYLPVSQLVWVLSVRRLERKLGQALSDRERAGQRNRARFLAVILCVIFSALFNYQILDMTTHGG